MLVVINIPVSPNLSFRQSMLCWQLVHMRVREIRGLRVYLSTSMFVCKRRLYDGGDDDDDGGTRVD
jgi:hypothetical protein